METIAPNSAVAIVPKPARGANQSLWALIAVLAMVPAAGLILPLARGDLSDASANSLDVRWLGQSALLSLLLAIVTTVITGFASYALSRSHSRRVQHSNSSTLATVLLGGTLLLLPIYVAFSAISAIDPRLKCLLVYLVIAVPFCTWRLKVASDAIPNAVIDAARLDGCAAFERLRLIVLPLLARALLVCALFCFTTAWNLLIISSGTGLLPRGAAAFLCSIPLLIVFLLLGRRPSLSESETGAG